MRLPTRTRLTLWHPQVFVLLVFALAGATIWFLSANALAIYFIALAALFFQLASSWSLSHALRGLAQNPTDKGDFPAEVQALASVLQEARERVEARGMILERIAVPGPGTLEERSRTQIQDTQKLLAEVADLVARQAGVLPQLRKAVTEEALALAALREREADRENQRRQMDYLWQQLAEIWSGSSEKHRSVVEDIPARLHTFRTMLRTLERTQKNQSAELKAMSTASDEMIVRLNELCVETLFNVRNLEVLRAILRRAVERLQQLTKTSGDCSSRVQDITDLIGQINLMSINSLLESMRVNSDAGSLVGIAEFTLVADEIRNVAEQAEAHGEELVEMLRQNADRLKEGIYELNDAKIRCEALFSAYDSTVQDLSTWIEMSEEAMKHRKGPRQPIEIGSALGDVDDIEKGLVVLEDAREQVNQSLPKIENMLQGLIRNEARKDGTFEREVASRDIEESLHRLQDLLDRLQALTLSS